MSLADLGPTLLELTGARAIDVPDSHSLAPLLANLLSMVPKSKIDLGYWDPVIHVTPMGSRFVNENHGHEVAGGRDLQVTGHAWAGDREVEAVHVSIDFGATWQAAALEKPASRMTVTAMKSIRLARMRGKLTSLRQSM